MKTLLHASIVALASLLVLIDRLSAQNLGSLLDTSSIENGLTRGGVLTQDGGLVLSLYTGAGMNLWKCDASGTPQWSIRFGTDTIMPYAETRLIECADGALVFLSVGPTTANDDSTTHRIRLTRVSATGDLIWHKDLLISPPNSGAFGQWSSLEYDRLVLMETSDDELLIGIFIDQGFGTRLNLARFNAAGDLLWSKYIGQTAWDHFLVSSSGNVHRPLAIDQAGGCVLAVSPTSQGDIVTVRIDGGGNVLWATLVDYGLYAAYFDPMSVMVDVNNRIMVTSNIIETYSSMHRLVIDDDGTFVRADGYAGTGGNLSQLRTLPTENGTLMQIGSAFISIDTLGTIQGSIGFGAYSTDSIGSYNFAGGDGDHQDGYILLPGTQHLVPFSPDFPVFRPGFIKSSLSDPGICVNSTFPLSYVTLPNDLFESTPVTDMGSTDAFNVAVDVPEITSPATLFGVSALCSTVGLHETPWAGATRPFIMNRTLLLAGDPLTVTSDRPLRYSIVDVKGAVVWNDPRASQQWDIPTAQLASGLYTLLGREVTGQVVGTAKMAVER